METFATFGKKFIRSELSISQIKGESGFFNMKKKETLHLGVINSIMQRYTEKEN